MSFGRVLKDLFEDLAAGIMNHEVKKVQNGFDTRRLSCNSSRRSSICSSRISEIPVENIVQQSKVNTLQWQLQEVEKSRDMYKAMMKQVVTFLEKAHRSLELLGSRLNTKTTVSRSKSEHQILSGEDGVSTLGSSVGDYTAFRDFTLRRPKKPDTPPDEIPPEKLSQEAFRLLRTAQSLLNTEEPKLSTMEDPPNDLEFLSQLAKEFPQELKPQRATSFSLSPKLLKAPDKDIKISTAFNRKLSLQLKESRRYKTLIDTPLLCSTLNENLQEKIGKFKAEKSNSPPAGSVSSMEDESGFSSMNSFQEVGLPVGEEVNTRSVLLKSMLQNGDDGLVDEVKLWQKAERVAQKRWNANAATKQTLNVLWV